MDNNHILDELVKTRKLVVSLAREIDAKNRKSLEMEQKLDENFAALQRMQDERARQDQAHLIEMTRSQFTNVQNVALQQELALMRNKIEQITTKFENQEAKHDGERKRLLLEIEKVRAANNFGLPEDVDSLRTDLAEKEEEMQSMDDLNQALILREHELNLELQDARKALIHLIRDYSKPDAKIGIRRMGEVDQKPFVEACKKKFSGDWEMKSTEVSSLWQHNVNNPSWHPFKRKFLLGKHQEIVDENDEKLKELRGSWGEGAYKAVHNALLEMNEYNPSGRYVVSELWNFGEGRKASTKEAVEYIVDELKSSSKSAKRRR